MEAASSEFDRLLHFLGEDAGHVRCRLLQTLFESMSEGLAVIDQEGRTVVVNDRLASLLGRSAEQLSGQLLLDLVDARDRGSVARALQAGSDREGGPHEFRLLRQDTIPMHVIGTFAPLTSSDGATRGVAVLISDVTWPREIEDQLRWRLRYEEAAAFCAQALVGTVNLDDVIPRVCRKLLEATGVSRVYVFEDVDDPCLGLCMRQRYEVVAPGIVPEMDDVGLQCLAYEKCAVDPLPAFAAGRHFECLVREVGDDGKRQAMERRGIKSILLLPICVEGRQWGFIGFNDCREERLWRAEDIRVLRTAATIIGNALENDRAQSRVRAYQNRLQQLASALTLAEERGRRKVATDLHDDVSQSLALATMRLKSLAARCPEGLAAEAISIGQLLEQVVQHVRTLTFDLSPPVLYELGLGAAVEWLADNIRARHSLSIVVDAGDTVGPADETTRVLVFRAVRELLMNVVKHSGATEARVALSQGVASIHIVVEDNGRGFDTREVHTRSGPAGGFGLFDIRERLAHIGGRLDVSSKPGSGVRATMFVPLNQRGARRPEVTCDEHTNTIGR